LGQIACAELYRHIVLFRTTKAYSENLWNSGLKQGLTVRGNRWRPISVLESLSKSAHTSTLVKILDLEVITNSEPLLYVVDRILCRVAPSVVDLRLKFVIFNLIGKRGEIPWSYVDSKATIPRFPKLRRLELVHATHRSLPWVLSLLEEAPYLRSLIIDCQSGLRETFMDPLYQFTLRPLQPPSLTTQTDNILELHSTSRGQSLPPVLVQLYQATPNLEKLVWGHSPDAIARGRRKGTDLWRIISEKEKLQVIIWAQGSSREFYYAVSKSGGFENLKEVVLGDHDIKARALVPQVSPGTFHYRLPMLIQ
jgi:hypothetical protein